MASCTLRPHGGTATTRLVTLTGDLTLGATGALSSQSCDGFTVGARSAAGRYLVTLGQKYRKLRNFTPTFKITGTGAYTAGRAITGFVRDWNAAAGTFTIQLCTGANADADAPDSCVVGIVFDLVQ